MVELLIGFDRPQSLSEAEMRSWVQERAAGGRPAVKLGRAEGADTTELLWVSATPEAEASTEDQIADLMLDMRLLGLRPTVMAGTAGFHRPATA